MRRPLAGLALVAALLVGGAGPAGRPPGPARLVGGAGPASAARQRHERSRCYDDCDGGDSYGDGGSGGGQGASGGDYGHGKNGDQGDAGRDQCHSFCNNIIIIPNPMPGGQQPGEPR